MNFSRINSTKLTGMITGRDLRITYLFYPQEFWSETKSHCTLWPDQPASNLASFLSGSPPPAFSSVFTCSAMRNLSGVQELRGIMKGYGFLDSVQIHPPGSGCSEILVNYYPGGNAQEFLMLRSAFVKGRLRGYDSYCAPISTHIFIRYPAYPWTTSQFRCFVR